MTTTNESRNAPVFCRTRSGSKVHRGSRGSVMSYCGVRVVAAVQGYRVKPEHFCGSCFFGDSAAIAQSLVRFFRAGH